MCIGNVSFDTSTMVFHDQYSTASPWYSTDRDSISKVKLFLGLFGKLFETPELDFLGFKCLRGVDKGLRALGIQRARFDNKWVRFLDIVSPVNMHSSLSSNKGICKGRRLLS